MSPLWQYFGYCCFLFIVYSFEILFTLQQFPNLYVQSQPLSLVSVLGLQLTFDHLHLVLSLQLLVQHITTPIHHLDP